MLPSLRGTGLGLPRFYRRKSDCCTTDLIRNYDRHRHLQDTSLSVKVLPGVFGKRLPETEDGTTLLKTAKLKGLDQSNLVSEGWSCKRKADFIPITVFLFQAS